MGFICAGRGLDQQFAAVAVDGEVFELGLRFEGFGVVDVVFAAAADGAEYVDIHEHIGIGILRRNDFDAAQVKHGLYEVGEERYVARVGNQGFAAVVAGAVGGKADAAFVFCAAVAGNCGCGGVEQRCGGGIAFTVYINRPYFKGFCKWFCSFRRGRCSYLNYAI